MNSWRLGGFLVLTSLSCGPPPTPAAEPARLLSADDAALSRVAAIHGVAGPWVVAGYRMGTFALDKLGLAAQSFDLEVVHHTPHAVQYSCIADGAAAATGASVGKLNLELVAAEARDVATTYRRRSTGQSLTLRPTAAFTARFRDVPLDKLAEAGKQVLALADADIFEVVMTP